MNKQKYILITGCSTGIGRYCAIELNKRPDYQVIATVRQQIDIKPLQQQGLKHIVIMDLNNQQSIVEGFSQVTTISNNHLYAVFHNAAYGQPGALEDITTEVLKEQFESNFFAWHTINCLAIKLMRKNGSGKLIHNSSVLGLISLKFRGAYNASKYAIEALCDTLRLELYQTNIDVVLIEPGPISSNFRQTAYKKFKQHINSKTSYHKQAYQIAEQRLNSNQKDPFTLEPDAVYKKLLKALQSKNPKAHYFVTFPTYLFAYLKRILPTKWLDNILRKV